MGIPDDVVLDGYTLIEQHEIDHEFLLRGSPLGTETPLLFALTIVGIVLVAASFFLRGGSRVAAGLVGALLTLTFLRATTLRTAHQPWWKDRGVWVLLLGAALSASLSFLNLTTARLHVTVAGLTLTLALLNGLGVLRRRFIPDELLFISLIK